MKILVIGCGYVGLATGTCLAEVGNEVVCVDKNVDKITGLQKGEMPLYEPELQGLLKKNVDEGRLKFGTEIVNADIAICAVGTPTKENGETDLTDVFDVAKSVGEKMNQDGVFIMKSTVPVGTTLECKKFLNCHVVSNPEFLRQGAAIQDTMAPDRIIIGTQNKEVEKIMENLYAPFVGEGRPIVFMDIASAELSKYAANAFLSTKISFINEMADFCSASGANIKQVANAIGLDSRIGPKFLNAGIGYGGGCLGKDNKSLIGQAKKIGKNLDIVTAVEARNEMQKNLILKKFEEHFGDLNGHTICLLGLSFKPKTDDLRDAPSNEIVKKLLQSGAIIKVYDPVSADKFIQLHGAQNILKAPDMYEAGRGADAIVITTEWDEFKDMDFNKMKALMKGSLLVDGRNICDPALVKNAGLKYIGIGVS